MKTFTPLLSLTVENHRLKLECVNESVCRADALRVLGESLPKTISIAPQPLISTQAIKGETRLMVL